jgi:hypothetical protein
MVTLVGKRLKAKPPRRVVELDDDRHAIDVEDGWRIIWWREGDHCHVKVETERGKAFQIVRS